VIDGETTRLRAPIDDDLAVLGALRNDVALQQLLLARPRPNSPARVQDWIRRVSDDPAAVFFVVADRADDRAVGFVQITEVDLVSGHGRLGIALDGSARRRGHGREAVVLAARHVHAVFGVDKIVLDVRADNEAAIALYQGLGFREVGVLRAHYRAGEQRHDVLIMEWSFESRGDR
jgi:RimJ/RimL family protein N-acetyltransferase